MATRRTSSQGSISKLPSGSWRARISLEGRRVSHTAPTRQAARDWIRSMLDQMDKGLSRKTLDIRFGEFADEWLTAMKPNLRRSTFQQYSHISRDYLIPSLKNILLRELRRDQVQALYNRLQPNCGRPLMGKIHQVLHRALEHARLMGYIVANPADLVILPSQRAKEMKILDESQVSRLIVAAKGARHEVLINLAIYTGMRQMELLGLKWIDIDWVRKSLIVQRQLQRKHKGEDWGFFEPKTHAGRRTITLGNKAIEMLRARYEQQRLERIAARDKWQEFGLVFTTYRGTPFEPANIFPEFKNLLKRAGVPDIRFHDLRHTAASLMLNHGIPPFLVSKRLGHARVGTTLDTYGHLLPGADEEAVRLLDELFTPLDITGHELDTKQESKKIQ